MKLSSLLDELRRFFNQKLRKQEAKRKQLKIILKKLKKEQSDLRNKLSKARDSSSKSQLERKIRILHKQRKKGIALHRELRK